ncbi:MAG: DUF6941 family protein [Dehalococcoidia bacterium]
MQLAYAFPSSAAEFSSDGKVYVLGGDFDTLRVPGFPATQPSLALVVKLHVQPMECYREHRLRIDLIDDDGARVYPEIGLPFTPQTSPNYPHRRVGVGLVITLQGLTFPRPGGYAFHILVDDLEIGTVPLYLE